MKRIVKQTNKKKAPLGSPAVDPLNHSTAWANILKAPRKAQYAPKLRSTKEYIKIPVEDADCRTHLSMGFFRAQVGSGKSDFEFSGKHSISAFGTPALRAGTVLPFWRLRDGDPVKEGKRVLSLGLYLW